VDKDDNTIVLEPAQPESAAPTLTLGGETVTLDFGSLTLPSQSLSYSYSGSSIDTISIPTITSIGSSCYNTSSYNNYTWNNSFSNDPAVKIDSNGLDIKEGGDIKVGGKSLLDAISKIEERLAILKPNPEMEDKWDELKELGQRYRALEKELYEKEKMWEILKRDE
jgi:hypothetical protein